MAPRPGRRGRAQTGSTLHGSTASSSAGSRRSSVSWHQGKSPDFLLGGWPQGTAMPGTAQWREDLMGRAMLILSCQRTEPRYRTTLGLVCWKEDQALAGAGGGSGRGAGRDRATACRNSTFPPPGITHSRMHCCWGKRTGAHQTQQPGIRPPRLNTHPMPSGLCYATLEDSCLGDDKVPNPFSMWALAEAGLLWQCP